MKSKRIAGQAAFVIVGGNAIAAALTLCGVVHVDDKVFWGLYALGLAIAFVACGLMIRKGWFVILLVALAGYLADSALWFVTLKQKEMPVPAGWVIFRLAMIVFMARGVIGRFASPKGEASDAKKQVECAAEQGPTAEGGA
jgi:hypothetical protein